MLHRVCCSFVHCTVAGGELAGPSAPGSCWAKLPQFKLRYRVLDAWLGLNLVHVECWPSRLFSGLVGCSFRTPNAADRAEAQASFSLHSEVCVITARRLALPVCQLVAGS